MEVDDGSWRWKLKMEVGDKGWRLEMKVENRGWRWEKMKVRYEKITKVGGWRWIEEEDNELVKLLLFGTK